MKLTRYGAPCVRCGILRDYHDLTPKDHHYKSPHAQLERVLLLARLRGDRAAEVIVSGRLGY